MARRVYKTLLKPGPDDARVQLEELALRHEPGEYAAGEQLRAVAAELVSRGLEVTAVDYRDGSQELEVVLSPGRPAGLVTVDRDGSGQGCQLSWEQWVDITDEAGVRRAADRVDAVLRGVARPGPVTDEPGELAALRDAFPGYRFRRRDFRGVPAFVAEARRAADAPLAAARTPAILADMLAAAAGRPVRLRPAAVAAVYRDGLMTVKQCALMFGVSRTTIMKFLAAEGVALRRPGGDVDEAAVVAAYRDEGLSLHDCAARFGISQRRVAATLERHGVSRRPVGRPPRRPR